MSNWPMRWEPKAAAPALKPPLQVHRIIAISLLSFVYHTLQLLKQWILRLSLSLPHPGRDYENALFSVSYELWARRSRWSWLPDVTTLACGCNSSKLCSFWTFSDILWMNFSLRGRKSTSHKGASTSLWLCGWTVKISRKSKSKVTIKAKTTWPAACFICYFIFVYFNTNRGI